MGLNFFDNFSYLHFASGVIANFWNVSFTQLVIFHTTFEILENTPLGVKFIQKTFDIIIILIISNYQFL